MSIGKIITTGTSVLTSLITTPILTGKLGYDPRNSLINFLSLNYSLWKHYIGNLSDIKPSAVVAGIPLPSVDELSHGISDREVRYRANGGVFLSHQTGGNESLRIVGKAWGDNRFLFLSMLDLLFLWGTTTQIDMYANKIGSIKILELAKTPRIAKVGKAALRLKEIDKDPWREFDADSPNSGYQEQHMTFPVISKNRVYLSMFIETYSWRQRIDKENRKMVEYTIFFRKYEPQPQWDFRIVYAPPKDPGEKPKKLVVYKEKTPDINLISAAWKASIEILATISIHEEVYKDDNFIKFGQQFILNYFGNNNQDDKIPGIIQQRGFF